MPFFAFLALFAYAITLALIIPALLKKGGRWRQLAVFVAIIAVLSHTCYLQQRIFTHDGRLDLSLLTMGSAVSLLTCLLMTIVAACRRGWLLLPFVYGFAFICLIFNVFVPNTIIAHLENTPGMLIHIALSLFAWATLIIAALYALQLLWIDYLLKHKKPIFSADIQPLMRVERKMFHITQVGVTLLTLALFSGLFYRQPLPGTENSEKALLSILAWFNYLVLFWGHYYKGWRGRRVVWFNCGGVLLLTIAYFGSRILPHVLNR